METEFVIIFDSTKSSQSHSPELSQTNQVSEVPNIAISMNTLASNPNERFNITIVKKSKTSGRLFKISKIAKPQNSTDTQEPQAIKKQNKIYISIDQTNKLTNSEVFD